MAATKTIIKLSNTEAVVKIAGIAGDTATIILDSDLLLPLEYLNNDPIKVNIGEVYCLGVGGYTSLIRNGITILDVNSTSLEPANLLGEPFVPDSINNNSNIIVNISGQPCQVYIYLKKVSGYTSTDTAVVAPFNVLSLFGTGEQGAWYDPSDLTTLFQDKAGTIPVTLSPMEQPVGLMLDKSKGLALGSELVTNGGPFTTTTGWISTNTTLSVVSNELKATNNIATVGIASYSTSTIIGKMYFVQGVMRADAGNAVANSCRLNINPTVNSWVYVTSNGVNKYFNLYFTATGSTTDFSFQVASNGAAGASGDSIYVSNISVKQIAGNHAFQSDTTPGKRPLLSARVNLLLATATLSTQSVTTVATNYVLAFSGAGTVTLSGTATGVLSAGSNTFTATAGTLTLTVSGSVTLADLRPTNSGALLPPYQRVNTATDYDTVGFPLYLKCNGSSSAMSTNSINFTATDKMTVVTGIRKLSDTLRGMVFETTNMQVNAPENTNQPNYNYVSGIPVNIVSSMALSYFAPITNVITGQSTVSPPTNSINVNGVQKASTTTTQGSGFYSSAVLYLFARNQASLFFNGHFYGAIIRGAQSDTNSVVKAEQYMAKQTGITF